MTTVPALLAPGQRRGCAIVRSQCRQGWVKASSLRPLFWNECSDGRTRQMQHAGSCLLHDGHTDDCARRGHQLAIRGQIWTAKLLTLFGPLVPWLRDSPISELLPFEGAMTVEQNWHRSMICGGAVFRIAWATSFASAVRPAARACSSVALARLPRAESKIARAE